MRFIFPSLLAAMTCTARAEQPVSLFDPARHMHVSEVKPGMKGYGLSVFSGTKIEKFDVEVVSVLHDFNPKYDVVLIRCHGANLEHTGDIAGMSGSPIYLTDEQGKSRMIGAFAYGWPLQKDPIAGVQPIEYMLKVGQNQKPTTIQAGASSSGSGPTGKLIHFDPKHFTFAATNLTGSGDSTGLQPLATPLMTSGLSPQLLEQFGPILRQYGLSPLQAGGGGSSSTTQPAAKIEPGSVLAAPLLTGDVDLTAIGTCTEVIGNHVFAFGHPFNNEGPTALPMGSGEIHAIIANLEQSFKLGSMTQVRGTLTADQMVGIAGSLGKTPPTVPIDVHVIYTDGSSDTNYHFDCALHPKLTPLLSAIAVSSAMGGQHDLPQHHTVNYDLNFDFANGKSIEMKDVAVDTGPQPLLMEVAAPIELASDNPFDRVMVKKISGTIQVTPEAHDADILSVDLPKMKYRAGDTLKAFVRYRPFHAAESIMPIELPLPHDLRDGKYQLSICDQGTYIEQEQIARPFRFTAESIDDVFAVMKDVSSIRADALYVRLLRQADGVAIGRTAMPLLPSSRRQVMLDAGLSNVTPFISSAVKIVPTEIVMNGSAEFEIEIDNQEQVEVKGTRAPKPEPHVPPQQADNNGPPGKQPPEMPKHDVPAPPPEP